MSPLLRCVIVLIGLFAASAANAERFTVSARVFCPASWNAATNTLDETFNTELLRPCSGIRVVAMDADPLWDEFCGAGYTDSRGNVLFTAECGDTVSSAPEVYLKVEARSVNGFSVGVFDEWEAAGKAVRDTFIPPIIAGEPLPINVVDQLRSHRTLAWTGAEGRVDSGRFDVGDVAIGVAGLNSEVGRMAARQFWAAQYSMYRLRAGTKYLPMDFNYTVFAGRIGAPTTVYDTIMVSNAESVPPVPEVGKPPPPFGALRATPHEIGHVLYNTYHSGITHWTYDAPDYMTNHARCDDDHFQTLAWYEGFADFVRDYVFQRWDWASSDWTNAFPPFRGCAVDADGNVVSGMQDMHFEGNVEALLNNVFFGPVRPTQRDEIGRSRQADFTCPSGQTRVVTPIGVVECEREVPTTCVVGRYAVDNLGMIDQCVQSVRNCLECEPVEQARATSCAGGRALRRTGADACVLRSPATDALNGNPRPRPDGTPDMVLGHSRSGGKAWFSLPSLDDVMRWVIAAGIYGHRASDYWDGWLRPWCLTTDGDRYRYCNPDESPSFLEEVQKLEPAFN